MENGVLCDRVLRGPQKQLDMRLHLAGSVHENGDENG